MTVTAESKDGKPLSVDCDKVLVAVGRRPYTEGLNLEGAGVVKVEAKTGKVPVDAHFRTNVPTISAIGDLIAGPDAGPQGRGRGHRLRRDPGRQARPRQLRHHPERDLHLARDGKRGNHGGAGAASRG